jgi:hypothetical protein
MLPFTREQFLAVFVVHTHALWPAQLAAALLGLAIVSALCRRSLDGKDRSLIAAGLALMWLVTGR